MEVDSPFNEHELDFINVDTDSDAYIKKKKFSASSTLFEGSRYENKGGTFTTGINIFSKEEQKKMEERAIRFGLKTTSKSIDVEDENELYSSMGVFDDNENTKYIRLNVLHMRGTDEMSTQDVFNYFKDYAPASIEWINDVSCNVVWLDNLSAARALIGLSKRIIGLNDKMEIENNDLHDDDDDDDDDDDNEGNTINLKNIDFPLPPGIWRKGINCEKSQKILLRFAINSDKKQPNAEKLSEYYKKYGNPNFGGMRGILTVSRKRLYREIKNKRNPSDNINKDSQIDAKNPWGSLSQTWGTNDSMEKDFLNQPQTKDFPEMFLKQIGIKKRLGVKLKAKQIDDNFTSSETNSDSGDEWNKRTKVLRMRMHADDEEEKVQKKKLKQLTMKMEEKIISNCDLRSKLQRTNSILYKEPIKVTVTNAPKILQIETENEKVEKKHIENVIHDDVKDKEEGEWDDDEEDIENDEEYFDQTEKEVDDEEENSDCDSDISEKAVQGPKGSVIKVVQRAKPRVASTVWARLNHSENLHTKVREHSGHTASGDLRSRLSHNRERSPLRIEVRNDKYTKKK